MIPTKINGSWNIVLPEHRASRPEWFREEGWEKKRLESIHDNIKEDDTLFYIGAEEGDMPGLCSMWGADLVLFEPNDLVWSNIKAIWEANKLNPPLATFCGFASDIDTVGKIPVHIDSFPPCADNEIISNHAFKELHSAGDIPQVRIDSFVQSLHIIPDAITLDVEGSEWKVLKGAENTLKEYHPKIWLSLHPEFMFRIYGDYQFELRKWIKDLGYKETLLDYQHEVHLFYEKNI